jgi:hypothetical protein
MNRNSKSQRLRFQVSVFRFQFFCFSSLTPDTRHPETWSLGFQKFALFQYSKIKNRDRLQGLQKNPLPCRLIDKLLSDGSRRTKVAFLHSHPATTRTGIFHLCQLILAHVFCIHLRSATETTVGRISAGITQMPRVFSDRPTILTGMSHICPPFAGYKPIIIKSATATIFSIH